jgi:hypothetical protein
MAPKAPTWSCSWCTGNTASSLANAIAFARRLLAASGGYGDDLHLLKVIFANQAKATQK